jgi:hypothetical protein
MSTNIFKTAATSKNSSNKGSNNSRFSSLKDELIEKPIDNSSVIHKKEKVKEKSRFNFDDDDVNVFFTAEIAEDTRDTRDTQNNTYNTYNSFTTLKVPSIKQIEPITIVYNEELFPELTLKKSNSVNPEKISFADKLKLKQTEVNKEDKPSLVEKLKIKYKEDNEENKRNQEEKRIQEEKDYVKPGWVYFRRDPNTKKWYNYYGNNSTIVVRPKNFNEHINYWIDGVVDRYETRKELLENNYGVDYSNEEDDNIEYFDMLDAKAEQEIADEKEEIVKKYLNDHKDDDSENYDSYSNDYWKKR